MQNKEIFLKISSVIKKNIPLIIAVTFWVIISILLVIFVNVLFQSGQEEIVERERIVILSLILFSLSLIIFIIIYLLKLFLSIKKKEFGARMRLKITLFFIFVVILPTIPFIQIGTKFISSSMNLWFSKNFGFSLDLSEEIIRTYYNEKKNLVSLQIDKLNDIIEKQKLTYKSFIDYIPKYTEKENIDNISIWDKNGELLRQYEDNVFEVKENTYNFEEKRIYLQNNIDGIFNVDTKNGKLYLILPAKIFDINNNMLGFLNIGIIIHPKYNKAILEIEDSLRNYNTASLYKDFFTRGFSFLFLAIVFPIILVILIIALFLSKEILDPIENLSKATRRVAEGDLNFQVYSTFNDEFMILSKSFNQMISELELSRNKLKQKEKIETWQEIARQLAHEIKNPLTPIKLSVERLVRKYNIRSEDLDEIVNKCSRTILKEVENINGLLEEFSNFSKLTVFDKKVDEVVSILQDAILYFSNNEKNITINLIPIIKEYKVLRDKVQLKEAFLYIFKFFIENSNENDLIEVFTDKKEIGFKKYLVIVIKNKYKIERNDFTPYFGVSKNQKKLNLLIAEKIVSEHEGRIYTNSHDEVNNLFIELPIYNEDAE